MISFLVASQILLWIAVIAVCCISMGLARQVGVLHERIAPAGALMLPNNNVKVGQKSPEFTLPTIWDGISTIGSAEGRVSQLVFFLSPDCPVCKTLLPIIKSLSKHEAKWLRITLASDGSVDAHKKFAEKNGLSDFEYVLSEELGKVFQVSKLPYAVLIDENGAISSMGLVNSREHLESLFEAKERKIVSLQDYLASN